MVSIEQEEELARTTTKRQHKQAKSNQNMMSNKKKRREPCLASKGLVKNLTTTKPCLGPVVVVLHLFANYYDLLLAIYDVATTKLGLPVAATILYLLLVAS